eukprot:TRINITY_DN8904_c0_g1_i1.p1 TRINITY_DN8904_c0_g1~~TRINITY_DN8904_c0_g1_i1.p1  ORF type:complete len:150 (+),score=43.48 TRINITY_DN8904_c0_g1_i1:77-526(+)
MEARRLATCYDDENALELVFPKEFANAEFISNSEALIHLERHREELIGKGKSIEDDELFKRFYSHCKALAKFDQNGLTEARSELKDDRMERYEMAALLDLLPQDLEECYELIPSLGRYKEEQGDFSRDASNQTEDRLIALLESIRSHRK